MLRGPQGTLFGAGSEGGTVRYITTAAQPDQDQHLRAQRMSITPRAAHRATRPASPRAARSSTARSGARATLWYRRDGGWIDRVDPTAADPQTAVVETNANHARPTWCGSRSLWAPNDHLVGDAEHLLSRSRTVHDISTYWPIYSNPGSDQLLNGDPTPRATPDKFYLPALKIEGDFDAFHADLQHLLSITATSRPATTARSYNLGFYSDLPVPGLDRESATGRRLGNVAAGRAFPLLDGTGIHLPPGIENYRSPASIDNDQENIVQEVRLVSSDPNATLVWTTGLFFSENRQSYLEQIHDPLLEEFTEAALGDTFPDAFSYSLDGGNTYIPLGYDPAYPTDSYFLNTHATDKQYAWYGEATYSFTDTLKATVGLRESHTFASIQSVTGGPQLFAPTTADYHSTTENAFTPKVNLAYQFTRPTWSMPPIPRASGRAAATIRCRRRPASSRRA